MGKRSRGVLFAAAVVVLISACKKKDTTPAQDDTEALVQDGTDTSFVESDSELLTSSLVGGAAGSLALADVSKTFFFPRGCLVVTNDDATKTAKYAFNGCTGPLGLAKIKGDVTATYEMSPNELVLDLVGNDLSINRATVDWHAHAQIVADGSSRTMTWSAQLSGTTARGREFSRTNTKTVKWNVGDRCFELDGVAEGKIKDRDVKTEVVGFKRCGQACPEAGGRITITNVATGTRVDLTFDGTSNATFTSPKGSATIPLICAG
jgi:hypothetical protein